MSDRDNMGITPEDQKHIKKMERNLRVGLLADASDEEFRKRILVLRSDQKRLIQDTLGVRIRLSQNEGFQARWELYMRTEGFSEEEAKLQVMIDLLMEERYGDLTGDE